MTRNDVHSPKNLVTEDYDYIWAFDNRQPFVFGTDFALEIAQKLGRSNRPHGDNHRCDHCGAHIRYVAVLEYKPTGDYITVGETCLDNRFDRATADFQRMRKQAVLDQKQQRIMKLKIQFVLDNPDIAWLLDESVPEVIAWNDFVQDISRKLKLYGELSDAQMNAVRKSYEKALENEAKRATEPKINWIPASVSSDRVIVTGEVLSSKWIYSDFGDQLKMMFMVTTEHGSYKLWMTVPRGMSGDRGERAKIKVKIMAGWAEDDSSLGKGNRPHLIELLKDKDDTETV